MTTIEKPNPAVRLLYSMLREPTFGFNYFNRDERHSEKKGGVSWEIMQPQEDYLYSQLLSDELVISSGRSVGKCENFETIVTLEDGTETKVKYLINVPSKLQSFNQQTRTFGWETALAEDNGTQPCLELTLLGNLKTKVTNNHPFLTMEGWKEIRDLKVGDYIAQPKRLPTHPIIDDSPSDDELKLIGYLLGDGCITRTVGFINIHPLIVTELKHIVRKFGCILKQSSKDRTRRGNYRIIKNIPGKYNPISNLLRELELLGKGSHTKIIPMKYFKCSNDKLALLINRLYACDGWVDKRGIGICLVSETLIDQLQRLLLRYGIRAMKYVKRVKYNGGINLAFTLNIGLNYIQEFNDQIGIFTKLTPEYIQSNERQYISHHKYEIPISEELYNELKSQQIHTTRDCEVNRCRIRRQYSLLNESKLIKFLEFNDIPLSKYSHLWTNITWVKIKDINNVGELPTVAISVPSTETLIADGILSHNTSSIEHLLFKEALTKPKKWTGYIVKNQRHANVLEQHLIGYFNKNDLTREFYSHYDKKDRIFSFINGHKIEIRIVGHDKTGSTTLVSGHFDLIVIDEAQLLNRVLLNELLPALKEGGKVVIAGVPNDIRDSILYYGCSNSDYLYLKYASTESADWDESKRDKLVKRYGGEDTQAWKNLINGDWGDSAAAVFRPSQLIDNLRDISIFKFKSFTGNRFEDLQYQMNLPPLLSKYKRYVLGGDMGYTANAPLHICILGEYLDTNPTGETKQIEHYDVIYRLEIDGMTSYNIAKVINYLLDYFKCNYAGIDAQTVGYQVYSDLCNREIFPSTYVRNKSVMLPVIFTKPVIMSRIKSFNQNTNQDEDEEIVYAMKVAGTMKLVELVEQGRFHIATEDARTDEYEDLVTIMQAETQSAKLNKLHPFVYANTINPHCTDGLRCCALVIYLIIEKGMYLDQSTRETARPIRMTSSIFNQSKPNWMNKVKRRR